MTPYYSKDGIVLYCGDNREILPELGRFDLLLTDPPYGLNLAANPFRQKFAKQSWDESAVETELLFRFIEIAVSSIVWGGNYFALPSHQKFLVWDKVQPEDFSSAMCEQAWTNIAGPAKLFRHRVVSYAKVHPTQKPLALMRWCLQLVPDAKTVLDCYSGSGTTLLAAKLEGRQCTGIEISEDYCRIAVERLKQGVFNFAEGDA